MEFNRISHFQEPNGRIYFGGLNGITTFDPRDFENERPSERHPLYLTAFRQREPAQGKVVDKTAEVQASGRIRIPPGDGTSVLDFAFLNFDEAFRNVYAYQLVGLNEGWQTLAEPRLRLSNLPYGDYTLHIKAQAANGQWSANTLTLTVTVVRPAYLRTWFLVLLVVLAVLSWARWRSWANRQEQQRLQSEIKQATATISQQAEVLQQLDQTKSRFFANISHEFRTPLTVILGMTNELRALTPTSKARKIADLMERNGTNLLRLINQILDLSKLEAGEMRLTLVRADLVGFIRYVGESFHSIASRKQIQLAVLSEQTSYETDLDKDKVQDIVSNLLSNAIKFTPLGGQVSCQLKIYQTWQPLAAQGYYEEVTPTHHLQEPWIQISVSDSGPGIDPASLSKLFDRFYQASNPQDSQAGGTGIGLALVRELVVLMQGGLAVRNRSEQGAEFVVSLPVETASQTPDTPPKPLPTGDGLLTAEWVGPSQRVISDEVSENEIIENDPDRSTNLPRLLLVEDNDDVAAYIQLCVQADYQVIRAENGQIGIDTALEQIPDLILSDVMMPLKDGFEVCHTLKSDQRTSHIPVVLLTVRVALSDRIDGLRRGADAYLVKPFQREELLLVLSNLFQTRRVLQLHYSHVAISGVSDAAPANVNTDSLDDAFLRKLRTVIDEKLENADLSIEQICEQMGMSRTTLHMKLTALTGMSANRYIRSFRLQKAQALLTTSALNISEVAWAVGFDDPKYFSRVFSEKFGISPGSFRASGRN